jgi:hypothetical protein
MRRFFPDSLFGRRCAHYKQEQCVSFFPDRKITLFGQFLKYKKNNGLSALFDVTTVFSTTPHKLSNVQQCHNK